jgi:hypothetical protein
MKNISFSLTEEQFLDGTKDVTRRLGWKNLKPGDSLMACRKCMGLKPGEKIVKLGEIEVMSVRIEPLFDINNSGQYSRAEAVREGFPNMTYWDFVLYFCSQMRCSPDQIVTRIEFKRI